MSPEEIEFWREVESLITSPVRIEIEYRVYYDVHGRIHKCSSIAEPSDEPYIVVSKTEYENYFFYQVVDKQLKKIDSDAGYRVKLQKALAGYTVVNGHAGIIVEPSEKYQDTEYYGYTNS
jgi:hypothetical protein